MAGTIQKACSSVAERCFYPAEVGGSTPSAPTAPHRLVRKARRRFLLTALLALPVLSACGGKTAAVVDAPDEPSSEYVIGPGDVLSISVYEAPPLSVEGLPVRPDGRISVPLAPDLVAAGKTPTQLGTEIEEKLKKYVQNPNVTVMVRSFQGPPDRQVRVIGEAVDPQAIPFRDNLTVLDVMIATRGLTKFAAGNSAVILRHVGSKEVKLHVRLSDLIKDGDISQNVRMRPGDTLIIPQSWF
jgi:polysaccharide export outer membrane protein